MAARAFPLRDRNVHVRGLERRFLFLMAAVAERRLFLLQHERADDAVTLMAGVTTFRVFERRVHDVLRRLLQDGLMAVDACLGCELPGLGACRETADSGQQTAKNDECVSPLLSAVRCPLSHSHRRRQ
jgi:hypothetical protein